MEMNKSTKKKYFSKNSVNVENYLLDLPFCLGVAEQRYLLAEEGIVSAFKNKCTHWYIDGSMHGDMVDRWSADRISYLNKLIEHYKVMPIYHGNFKVPLASDVNDLRLAALHYVKKEIDVCEKINAPLIVHASCIVEPRLIVKTKRKALENYVNSINEIGKYADKKGVVLFLENLSNYKNYRPFHYIFTNLDEYNFLFDKIENMHNIYFFLDIGHENICNGDSIEVIRKHHNIMAGISVSNNNGIRDQHLGINDGSVDYKKIVATLIECQWKGILAFETRNKSIEKNIQDLSDIYNSLLFENKFLSERN